MIYNIIEFSDVQHSDSQVLKVILQEVVVFLPPLVNLCGIISAVTLGQMVGVGTYTLLVLGAVRKHRVRCVCSTALQTQEGTSSCALGKASQGLGVLFLVGEAIY